MTQDEFLDVLRDIIDKKISDIIVGVKQEITDHVNKQINESIPAKITNDEITEIALDAAKSFDFGIEKLTDEFTKTNTDILTKIKDSATKGSIDSIGIRLSEIDKTITGFDKKLADLNENNKNVVDKIDSDFNEYKTITDGSIGEIEKTISDSDDKVLLNINNLNEKINKLKEDQKSIESSIIGDIEDNKKLTIDNINVVKESFDNSEVKLLLKIDDLKSDLEDSKEFFNKTAIAEVERKCELIELSLLNKMQSEHLRINDHVNSKMLSIKGDPGKDGVDGKNGDKGDKGDKGESGDSMLHKGVYKDEDHYMNLDVVMFKGSSYMSNIDNNNSMPTESVNWRMVAQKGGKGSRGIQGEKGIPGEKGSIPNNEDIVAIVNEVVSK